MNPDQPLVSVCVPIYNAQAFLEEALRSVLAQTYSNWELLIIDDVSTDGTREIIERFVKEANDPRIKVHFNPSNLGLTGNLSRGIELARGELIKVLCNDDTLEPDCLAVQVEALRRNPTAVLATCTKRIISAKGKFLFSVTRFPREGLFAGGEVIQSCLRTGVNRIGEPTMVLIRASATRDIQLFDNAVFYYCDLDLWLRLLTRGDLVFCKAPLAAFRIQGKSGTAASNGRMMDDHFRMYERISRQTGFHVSPIRLKWISLCLVLRNTARWLIYQWWGRR